MKNFLLMLVKVINLKVIFILVVVALLNTVHYISCSQNANISPVSIWQCGITTAHWSNFNGNVNVYLYKGNNWAADVITNVQGNGSQILDMKGVYSEVRNDWRIKVELRSNPNVFVFSNNFSVVELPPPSGLSLAYKDCGFRITWSNLPGTLGAPSYKIYWGTDNSVNETNHSGILQTNSTPYDHNGQIVGSTYYYRIKSCYNGCCSDLSQLCSLKYELPKPVIETPEQLTDGNGHWTGEVLFKWSDLGPNLRYELYVDNNSGFGSPEISPENIPDLNNHTDSYYTISANWLTPGYTYYCKVVAYYKNCNNDAAWSNVVSFVFDPYKKSAPNWAPLYRTFNKRDIEHFYCSSDKHLQIALDNKDFDDVTPLYVFEGIEGYVSLDPFTTPESDGLQPIYRVWFYNKTANPIYNKLTRHYYCTSTAEVDDAIIFGQADDKEGAKYEGIVGYTYKYYQNNKGLIKLFHTYLNQASPDFRKDNFYTTSYAEYINSKSKFGYGDKSPLCYVSQFGDNQESNPLDYMQILGSINTSTGGVSHSESCFSIPIGIMNLNFGIEYSSIANMFPNEQPSVGYGWSHTYSSYIKINDNSVTACWSGGKFHEYPIPSSLNTEYSTKDRIGVYDKLIKISPDVYQIKTKDQTIITFKKLSSADNTALLNSITDRKGNTVTCYYDSYFRLTEVAIPDNTSAFKKSLSFTYDNSAASINDKSKLIKEVIDNNLSPARKVSFEYDENSNLIKYTDVMGKVSMYAYANDTILKPAHLLTEITLPEYKKITNTFVKDITKLGKNPIASQKIGQGGNITTIGYSKIGGTASITTKLSNSSTETIYSIISSVQIPGLPASILKNGNTYTKYEYNNSQDPTLPTRIIDGRNNETNITYDNMGNTKTISKPQGENHSFNYNSFNDITDYTSPKGRSSYYTYDNANGNLIKIVTPRGNNSTCTTSINYNTVGLKRGTISDITDQLGRTTTFEYNNYGMKTKLSDPMNHITTFDTYDGANRLKQTTVENVQNAVQKNQITNYEYYNNDLLQKVSNAIDNRSITTQYEYDGNKNLTKVTDAKGNSTQHFYQNEKNLLDHTTNQIGKTTSYQYYDNGLTKQITKPNGNTINYEYDGLLHLSKTYFGSNSYLFTYDVNDNLLKIADNVHGDIHFDNNNGNNYDALDRLKSYIDFYGNTVLYEYDVNSNITKIIYPGNKYAEYTYYDDDLLRTVSWYNGASTVKIATYYYRNDGSLDYVNYGNSENLTKTKYSYDTAGRLKGLLNTKSNGDTINNYTYTLDDVGNHIKVEQKEPLVGLPVHSSTLTCSYDAANRKIGLTFNDNGNQIQSSSSTGNTYDFDELNRLTNISSSNYTASFVYDASGNRRAKTVNGITTKYILDINSSMSQVLAEKNESTNQQWNYIYGVGLIARVNPDGTLNYYHTDSRGSVIAMTDENQVITHKYAYNEFGEIVNKEELNPNPFRYVGGYGVMDDNNGLYYMRARYYDVATGRFISEDPKWATNLYWYGDGNPVMGIDPEGLVNYQLIGNIVKQSSESLSFKVLKEVGKIVLKETVKGREVFKNGNNIISVTRNAKGQFTSYKTVGNLLSIASRVLKDYTLNKIMNEVYKREGSDFNEAPGALKYIPLLKYIFGGVHSAE